MQYHISAPFVDRTLINLTYVLIRTLLTAYLHPRLAILLLTLRFQPCRLYYHINSETESSPEDDSRCSVGLSVVQYQISLGLQRFAGTRPTPNVRT